MQIKFVLLLSRQGKVRLSKWYTTLTQKERAKIIREITPMVLARPIKLCNFLDWKDNKVRCPYGLRKGGQRNALVSVSFRLRAAGAGCAATRRGRHHHGLRPGSAEQTVQAGGYGTLEPLAVWSACR